MDVYQIYKYQKEALLKRVEKLSGSTEEAKIIASNLNFMKNRNVISDIAKQYWEYVDSDLPKELSEKYGIDAKITDNLNVEGIKVGIKNTPITEEDIKNIIDEYEGKENFVLANNFNELYKKFSTAIKDITTSPWEGKYNDNWWESFKKRLESYIIQKGKHNETEEKRGYLVKKGIIEIKDKNASKYEDFVKDFVTLKYMLIGGSVSAAKGIVNELCIKKGLELAGY